MSIVLSTMVLYNPYMISAWVEYHTLIGVDYFYIYYHGKVTDEIRDIILPYDNVELIEWNVGKLLKPGVGWHHAQMAQLWHTTAKAGNNFDWVGNFDLDEYIVFKDHTNIKDFLSKYNPKTDFYLKFPVNWAMLDGMTEKEYLNFNLTDLSVRDTIVKKDYILNYPANAGKDCNNAGEGKYIYSPSLLENTALLKIHNIDLGHGKVGLYLESYPDRNVHETGDSAHYLHYKNMTHPDNSKDDYDDDNLVDWALKYQQLGDDKKLNNSSEILQVDNLIQKIIEENKND